MAYLEFCRGDRILNIRVGKKGLSSQWLKFHVFLALISFLYTKKLHCGRFVLKAKDVWYNVRA